jgi:hypothetical protein
MIARLTNITFPPDNLEEIHRNAGGPDGMCPSSSGPQAQKVC